MNYSDNSSRKCTITLFAPESTQAKFKVKNKEKLQHFFVKMLTDKCYRVKDLRPKRLESVSKDTYSQKISTTYKLSLQLYNQVCVSKGVSSKNQETKD